MRAKFTFLMFVLMVAGLPCQADAQQANKTTQPADAIKPDGQHDFDFEIGSWNTHLKRRLRPLTGSKDWVEYEGTTVVRKVWDGRANILELEVDGPAGHIEGATWRLFNPASKQWSLNFANSAVGTLSNPTIGEFVNGRGEFYSTDTLRDRSILVRFIISNITATSAHFEQAFSDDGGKSWEINWVADDTRIKDAPKKAASP